MNLVTHDQCEYWKVEVYFANVNQISADQLVKKSL